MRARERKKEMYARERETCAREMRDRHAREREREREREQQETIKRREM